MINTLCVTEQDIRRKLLSPCVDNQLAQTIFAGGRPVTKAIEAKEKDNYLSNVQNTQFEKYTYFIKNDCSVYCA